MKVKFTIEWNADGSFKHTYDPVEIPPEVKLMYAKPSPRLVENVVDLLFAIHRQLQEDTSKAVTPDVPPKNPAKCKRSGTTR